MFARFANEAQTPSCDCPQTLSRAICSLQSCPPPPPPLPTPCLQLLAALIQAKERGDPQGWLAFQTRMSALKLQRSRLEREAGDVAAVLEAAAQRQRQEGQYNAYEEAMGEWDGAQATSRWDSGACGPAGPCLARVGLRPDCSTRQRGRPCAAQECGRGPEYAACHNMPNQVQIERQRQRGALHEGGADHGL
jgi:hypothetical protein